MNFEKFMVSNLKIRREKTLKLQKFMKGAKMPVAAVKHHSARLPKVHGTFQKFTVFYFKIRRENTLKVQKFTTRPEVPAAAVKPYSAKFMASPGSRFGQIPWKKQWKIKSS